MAGDARAPIGTGREWESKTRGREGRKCAVRCAAVPPQTR
jgi:hypothetical protein